MSNIEMRTVRSSQIHSIGYDPDTMILRVCFWRRAKGEEPSPGSVYEYENVPQEIPDALGYASRTQDEAEMADALDRPATISVGAEFNALVKKRADLYPYRKLSDKEILP